MNSSTLHPRGQTHKPRNQLLKLEQRLLFDAAGMVDLLAADTSADVSEKQPPADASANAVPTVQAPPLVFQVKDPAAAPQVALELADTTVRNFIRDASADTLFSLFNGGQSQPDAAWLASAEGLRQDILAGRYAVAVQAVDDTTLHGALAAFTAKGPEGGAVIYLNQAWLQSAPDAQAIARVLTEELGHSLDAALNPLADTVGDEGQRFAAVALGLDTSAPNFATDDDHRTYQIGGESVELELANFSFVNAYKVNSATTPAGKESNSHDFVFTSLGVTNVKDDVNSRYFSGNDVAAIGLQITENGVTRDVFGWISRPIKVGGEVKGFYFWTDANFTSLAIAQSDGNQDGDSNVADNSAYILVVNQSHFDTLGWKDQPNNIKNIGSSSDRVDSALNDLIGVNTAPNLVNDSLTLAEDATTGNTGNLLTNDSDVDTGDTLRVSQFVIGNTTYTVAAPSGSTPTSTTATLSGVGVLTISSNGAYTFTPVANYYGTVPAVTYTADDGNGGTSTAVLSITVTPVNDRPTSSDDIITIDQNTTVLLGLSDFGSYQDLENNPLAKVVITSLPGAGTLEYWTGSAWAPVTQNQELSATTINAGKLRFTPATGASGTAYTSLGFRVSDGTDTSASSYTLTVNVSPLASPTAVADSGTTTAFVAKESGYNQAGYSATGGNVLGNDTPTSGLTVATVFNTVVGTNTQIKGTYGTLTISADGSYSYAADNLNPTVDALNTGGEVSESFTYTVTDSAGQTSSATLTVKIAGTNDTPVAKDDTNNLKETATFDSTNKYGAVSGTVLTNDSDVDNTGLTVVIGASTLPGATTYSLSGTSPISGITATFDDTGSNNWASTVPSTYVQFQVKVNGVFVTATKLDGVTPLLVKKTSPTILTFDEPAALYKYGSGAEYSYTQTSPLKVAGWITTITSSTVSSSTSLSITSGDLSAIQTGFVVSGTGVTVGTTVTAISGSTITLSSAIQIQNSSLTFTDPNSTISLAANQAYIPGTYGYLLINQDGTYTYKLTSNTLAAGQSYVENFSYQTQDAAGVTSAATLKIRVDGTSSATVPTAGNDALTVTEGTTGSIANILGNDTGTSVTGFTWGGQTGVVGTPLTIAGVGTLTITSTGLLTFAPAGDYNGPVPSVTYTAAWGTNSETTSATVALSITADNDAPTSTNDAVTMQKNTSVTLSLSDFGTYSDIEGDALASVKITQLPGAGLLEYNGGSWGAVTTNQVITVADINAGKLRYTPVTNGVGSNYTTVQFQVNDGAAFSAASSTLTVNVLDVPSPPVNTVPAAQALADYQTLTFTSGLSVADVDSDIASVTVNVANGLLAVTTAGGTAASSGAGTTASPLVLTGTTAEINAMLATLVYTPNSGFVGADTLRMRTVDSGGRSDTDFVDITVNSDNRALVVTGSTVNEASAYIVFEVAGQAGQKVSLALAATGAGAGHASNSLDYGTQLEYYNGSTWDVYTGGTVSIPGSSGAASLMVRAAVLQDAAFEGLETLKLVATNTAATAYEGTGGIRDDGQGTGYTAASTARSTPTAPSTLDDDRTLSVNSISVNEASPFAVFEVTGTAGQAATLALVSGSASATSDYGTALQYFDGTNWQTYSAAVAIPAGGKLLVRTTITNDTPAAFEGAETFALRATNQSNRSVVGTATILDDGTGVIFDGTVTANAATSATTGLEKDYILDVKGDGPVNEGSTYAMFNVTASAGESLDLSVTQTGASPATVGGFQIEFSYDGLVWTAYSGASKPVVPTGSASGEVYVRVDIRSEQDAPFEGAETFALNAAISASTTTNASAATTIIDNGTGSKYTGTVVSGVSTSNTTALDNDSGANVPATFGGSATASATEDSGSYVKTGTLTVTDPDSATTVVAQTNVAGSYGTFSIGSNGAWTYTANNSLLQPLSTAAQATETFTVASADGTTHNIVITLNGVNDAPTASAASVSTAYNTAVSGTLPTASDVDTGQTVSYSKASDSAHGTVTVNANGSYIYTPANGYSGADSFTYSVSDGQGGVTTYTVSIAVAANVPATPAVAPTAPVVAPSVPVFFDAPVQQVPVAVEVFTPAVNAPPVDISSFVLPAVSDAKVQSEQGGGFSAPSMVSVNAGVVVGRGLGMDLSLHVLPAVADVAPDVLANQRVIQIATSGGLAVDAEASPAPVRPGAATPAPIAPVGAGGVATVPGAGGASAANAAPAPEGAANGQAAQPATPAADFEPANERKDDLEEEADFAQARALSPLLASNREAQTVRALHRSFSEQIRLAAEKYAAKGAPLAAPSEVSARRSA